MPHPDALGAPRTGYQPWWRSGRLAHMRARRREPKSVGPDDRTWSARTNVNSRMSEELVRYTALPAETGPMWAPDRLALWPVEGGRYGIDAHYHGATGLTRAERQEQRLASSGLSASVRTDANGGIVRLGPLAHSAVWIALEAFLGRPVPELE
jgi:hypothetical protein